MDHPFMKDLMATGNYTTIYPYSEGKPRPNFTGELLMRAAGGIRDNPPVLVSNEEAINSSGTSELIALFHLGAQLTGHDEIVHGGLLATLLDEFLCRCGFPLLPHKIGVTAKLDIDYLAPTPSNSLLCLRAKTTHVDGRKVWVEGETFCLEDESTYKKSNTIKPTMKATLLAVEPKWYQKLANSAASHLTS